MPGQAWTWREAEESWAGHRAETGRSRGRAKTKPQSEQQCRDYSARRHIKEQQKSLCHRQTCCRMSVLLLIIASFSSSLHVCWTLCEWAGFCMRSAEEQWTPLLQGSILNDGWPQIPAIQLRLSHAGWLALESHWNSAANQQNPFPIKPNEVKTWMAEVC